MCRHQADGRLQTFSSKTPDCLSGCEGQGGTWQDVYLLHLSVLSASLFISQSSKFSCMGRVCSQCPNGWRFLFIHGCRNICQGFSCCSANETWCHLTDIPLLPLLGDLLKASLSIQLMQQHRGILLYVLLCQLPFKAVLRNSCLLPALSTASRHSLPRQDDEQRPTNMLRCFLVSLCTPDILHV